MPVNIKSYSIKSLIDPTTWTTGNGSATGFSVNGTADENHRFMDTDPFGIQAMVWEARPDATSGADGGWVGSAFNIDNTKLYRFSVWVNRTVQGNGSFYLGTAGYNSSNTNVGVYNRDNATNNTNPYFWISSTPTTIGEWTLVVGHVWPVGSGTGANHPDSGRYTIDGGRIGGISRDFVWRSDNTKAILRTFLYYSTDTSTRQRWVYPRVDLVDGTEPSIDELLLNPPGTAEISAADVREMNYDSVVQNGLVLQLDAGIFNTVTGTTWYDLSGNSNSGTLTNGPTFNSGNGGSIVFDGTNDYVTTPANIINTNADFTLDFWIKRTSDRDGIVYATYISGVSATGHLQIRDTHVGIQIVKSYIAYLDTFANSLISTLNQPLNIVVTLDKSSELYSLYVDGTFISSVTTAAQTYTTTNTVLGINYSNTEGLTGSMYSFRYYNRILSSTEIAQNYNVLKGRYGL